LKRFETRADFFEKAFEALNQYQSDKGTREEDKGEVVKIKRRGDKK
jgi:hypothetical protein